MSLPRYCILQVSMTSDPKCVVSILGCTDDWLGGWDGLEPGDADQFITPDLV